MFENIQTSNDSSKKIVLNTVKQTFHSPYIIKPAAPFELVIPPGTKKSQKLAYNRLFPRTLTDLEIELMFIRRYEFAASTIRLEGVSKKNKALALEKLKFHYRKAIYLISPDIAEGWNRWAEYILALFLTNTLHKVLWGSGGCGKSRVEGILHYIKWMVNPNERMTIIASMVVKESSARVFGYISEFHSKAPVSTLYRIVPFVGKDNKGIYVQMQDETTGKWINNERACIIALPIKIDADRMTTGDNLIGKHPDDVLTIAFDEAQEIPGSITEQRIYLNWLTNPRVEFHAWGNPNPVSFHAVQDYDLLFKLGVSGLRENELREKEKKLDKCDWWVNRDTTVLRLSTMDSPKDDEIESANFSFEYGVKKHRLEFLSGKNSIEKISAETSTYSPAYYSQVYGFPFIDYTGEWSKGVLSPKMIAITQSYPLMWKTEPQNLTYFMGVDSAPTGTGDECSIVVARRGIMIDSRAGIDLMNGQFCVTLKKDSEDSRQFTDVVIAEMLRISRQLRIPPHRIGVETHSSGEVLKYALQKSIEVGDWGEGWKVNGKFFTVSPVIAPTEREIFKELGKFQMAKDIVANVNTEYWLAARCAVMTRQMFNIPERILSQFYNRQLLMNTGQTKYRLETKDEMKKRGVRSPNDADALCNMLEVMRQTGSFGYKFRMTGSYEPYYTAERDALIESGAVRQRLGRVSAMLGVGVDLGTYDRNTGRVQERRAGFAVGKGAFNNESV